MIAEELSKRKLRVTPSRLAVLKTFGGKKRALSFPEVEKRCGDLDRVTVFRTLKTFVDAGILHPVLDNSGCPRYALCSHACPTHQHDDRHVHFKCAECGETSCLNEASVPFVRLPRGYRANKYNLLIEGVCKSCA